MLLSRCLMLSAPCTNLLLVLLTVTTSPSATAPSTSNSPPSPSVALAASPLSPQDIHFEIRTARSKSPTHKIALRAQSRSKSTPRSPATLHHPPPLPPSPSRPTKKKSLPVSTPSAFKQAESERSPSPVSHICSLTSAVSARSRKSSVVSATSASNSITFLDDIVVRETATWQTETVDSDDDSDSSLDLHTPLPHLMVKHGLLSPRSKLLPQPEDRPSRPDSVLSTITSFLSQQRSMLLPDSSDKIGHHERRTKHSDEKGKA
ncbi:hypothetical protein AGABI1DRAFT_130831 [Agaricus bisporus var. burnettii JB137-S8]|uniref:Uncharacterized protein n=1 Tax=Agaricus bisporus var. burnettii (strain JB137-S8 / ATCC MYA-4627 / FGSC 10392) TaxID=597362 RepID=K5XQN9_AGABU|nr:uncharacterized protein AGABI1DRAFT_130831 [Agaricus bisporus var. burnettii JB137-S8]EKM77110.1 hypothetical protein AGABI1DRAFT_130831 [Agaricus bisporus var. burnettii JB137-S8]